MEERKFLYKTSYEDLDYTELKLKVGRLNHTTYVDTDTLENIYHKHKDAKVIAVQRFNHNYRMVKDDSEDLKKEKYNGTIFIDFDYKNVWEKIDGLEDPKILYAALASKLLTYKHFYYIENSLHTDSRGINDSAHILFYYKDFDYNRYEDYYENAIQTVIECLEDLQYINVLNVIDKILDTCAKSPLQMSFITFKNAIFNDRCTGECDYITSNKINNVNNNKSRSYTNEYDKYDVVLEGYVEPQTVEYIEHTTRWRLFCSLSRLFKDNKLKQEWEKCATKIPEQNMHTVNYYKKCPYINDWYRNLKGDEYCDKNLLEQFGYYIRFVHKDDKVDVEWIDKKYDEMNEKYFYNILPKCKYNIINKKIKKQGCVYMIYGEDKLVMELNLYYYYKYGSKNFLLNILLHEMIHVWQYKINGKANHCKSFKDKADEINKDGWQINTTSAI